MCRRTCVAAGPGSANPIGGRFAAVKTYGRRIDDMIVKAPVSRNLDEENPKRHITAKAEPRNEMATAAVIREALIKAKKYSERTPILISNATLLYRF